MSQKGRAGSQTRGQEGGHPGTQLEAEGPPSLDARPSAPAAGSLPPPASPPARPGPAQRRPHSAGQAADKARGARRRPSRAERDGNPRASATATRTQKFHGPPAAPGCPPTPPEREPSLGPAAATAAARSPTRKCTEPASGNLPPRPLAGTTGTWDRNKGLKWRKTPLLAVGAPRH